MINPAKPTTGSSTGTRTSAAGKTDVFNRCYVFDDFSSKDVQEISRFFEVIHFSPDQKIYIEGEDADWMGFILAGNLKITKEDDNHNQVVISNEFKIKMIGEMSLIDGEKRSATCTSVKPVELLAITNEKFDDLAKEFPRIGLIIIKEVAKNISRRLRATSGRLIEVLG